MVPEFVRWGIFLLSGGTCNSDKLLVKRGSRRASETAEGVIVVAARSDSPYRDRYNGQIVVKGNITSAFIHAPRVLHTTINEEVVVLTKN